MARLSSEPSPIEVRLSQVDAEALLGLLEDLAEFGLRASVIALGAQLARQLPHDDGNPQENPQR